MILMQRKLLVVTGARYNRTRCKWVNVVNCYIGSCSLNLYEIYGNDFGFMNSGFPFNQVIDHVIFHAANPVNMYVSPETILYKGLFTPTVVICDCGAANRWFNTFLWYHSHQATQSQSQTISMNKAQHEDLLDLVEGGF